jgi:hypothetical protein
MEHREMLSNAQRQAASGRDRDAADAMRAMFPAPAEALIRPYLGPFEENAERTSLLDSYAM